MVKLQISILLSLLLLFAARAQADSTRASCEKEFAALAQDSSPAFAHWTWGNKIELRPQQVLPADFVGKLEASVGPVRVAIEQSDDELSFHVLAGDSTAQMRWRLYRVSEEPTSIRIDNLRMENPLDADTSLHLSQDHKGLPLKVFLFARDRLFAFAKAGGYTRLVTHGAQNFAVLMLYRKMVGMVGRDVASKNMIEYLDRIYDFSKTLPDTLRPKGLDDFARVLGDFGHRTPGADELQEILNSQFDVYSHTGSLFLPKGYRLYKDEKGEILAISKYDQLFFLNRLEEKLTVLQWDTISRLQQIPQLERDL